MSSRYEIAKGEKPTDDSWINDDFNSSTQVIKILPRTTTISTSTNNVTSTSAVYTFMAGTPGTQYTITATTSTQYSVIPYKEPEPKDTKNTIKKEPNESWRKRYKRQNKHLFK